MDDNASMTRSDACIREAIVQLLCLKLRSGATIESLAKFAKDCVERASRTPSHPGSTLGLDIHRLGSVLRSWHTDARFLSDDGTPRPLKMTGRNSLRTLIRLYFPEKLRLRVVRRLKEAELIRQQNRDGWLPIDRHARISQPSHEIIEHLSEGIARYVETVTNNVSAQNQEDVLFERSCKVTRLPIKEFGNFREYVAEQATAFISATDDWLERRNSPRKYRGKTQTAGVYTFAYFGNRR